MMGRGHERTRRIGDRARLLDDRGVALSALASAGYAANDCRLVPIPAGCER
ncbi:MAG: hypothetical protein ACRDZQ_04955 [Acidimicrobiales bacterium]